MPAAAGDSAAPDYLDMSLDQLMAIPVYAASKREQKTSDAPSSVTLVTHHDIRAYGWRTLGDLLRSVPGFYIIYDRSYGYVGVRGFGRPEDYGGRVLLLLDGHRMNDPLYDTAAILNDFIVNVDLIDRVEIIRGPGSALYGNNAFFATVNVITKSADSFKNGEISAEAGTHDTYKGRATYAARTSRGTELVVSASGLHSDGIPSVYLPEYDVPETGNGVVQGGDKEVSAGFFASLRRGGMAVEAAYVRRDKENPLPQYGTVFGRPVPTFDGRGVLDGRYQRAIRDDLQCTGRFYYDWYEFWGEYPYDMAEAGQSGVNRGQQGRGSSWSRSAASFSSTGECRLVTT